MAAKEKKGLGTGLGILFGEEEYNDENELRQLSVTKLVPRREQPRTVFDDASLQELADSLRRYGVISSRVRGAGAPQGSRVWRRSPSGSSRRTTAAPPSWHWWKICSART